MLFHGVLEDNGMRDLHEDSHLVMRHYLYHTASITAECFAEVLSDHYQMLFYLIITKSYNSSI